MPDPESFLNGHTISNRHNSVMYLKFTIGLYDNKDNAWKKFSDQKKSPRKENVNFIGGGYRRVYAWTRMWAGRERGWAEIRAGHVSDLLGNPIQVRERYNRFLTVAKLKKFLRGEFSCGRSQCMPSR
jgi:hypothetical protein